MGIITDIIAAYWEETDQIRKASARRKEEAESIKRQLQELISMRAARLVADDEFIAQREQLRRKLFDIQASCLNDNDASLTENEIGELTGVLSDLETAWRTAPVEAKRGFGQLLLPAGYVFQQVRTAETGLLFKTFEATHSVASNVVRPGRQHPNPLSVYTGVNLVY